MEVCIDSAESAANAEAAGATRVELCSSLVEGGTTPSVGMLRVIKRKVSIPVFVMIRPRGGDFVYSQDDFDVMKEDLCALKQNGADGFVFGILTPSGDVDKERCRELLQLCDSLPTTFHRAFDMTKDPHESLNVLVSLGFSRVLTSGQDSSALEGLTLISALIETAGSKITIVPGGGITERNLGRILRESKAREFHCSARASQDSIMQFRNHSVKMGASYGPSEFIAKYTDVDKASSLKSIAANFN